MGKFGFKREVTDEEKPINYRFNKIFKYLIIITWIVAAISLSITFLRIALYDPIYANYSDIFSLGIFWSFAVGFICILATSIINRLLSNEKRIEKTVLRNAMYGGTFVAYGLWFIQLVIFE
ncbi:MAG: hypothetical protein ACXAES_00975, partial [Promethearchaeota archaeon]